ncbi:hypothetical protein [Nocardia sp. NPDC059229]|uniref:hypothetical protein n=1 Tax=Nocardia sp. NPDC059229 TaxID=3346778 RepID=UPI003695B96F
MADRVTAVFLIVAAAVDFGSSFVPLVGDDSIFMTVWRTGEDGSLPLSAMHFTAGSIAVVVVAIALLAGAGLRNPAVRAAGGAAAAFIVANGIGGLSLVVAIMGFNFWEYAGVGFWLAVLTLLLSFAATVAALVAQLARPRLLAQPRAGSAPGFLPPGAMPAGPGGAMNPFAVAPVSNPFTPEPQSGAPMPNPFAPAAPTPNPFTQAAPAPNPFAPTAPAANLLPPRRRSKPPSSSSRNRLRCSRRGWRRCTTVRTPRRMRLFG